jgi:hypothetical protein
MLGNKLNAAYASISPRYHVVFICSLSGERTSLDKPCDGLVCSLSISENAARSETALPQGYLDYNEGIRLHLRDEVEERLCLLCSRLDFGRIFMPSIQPGKITSLPDPGRDRSTKCVTNRDISVMKEHSRCPLCRLLLDVIKSNDGKVWPECVVLRAHVEEFALTQQSILGRRLWVVGLDKK